MTPVNAHAYIRRETGISMVINGVLSAAFFLIVFGGQERVAVWGVGQWAFDFLPQSFMIALMSALVPGLLTHKRVRAGAVSPVTPRPVTRRGMVSFAIVAAIVGMLGGAALISAICWLSGTTDLTSFNALALKVAYGVALSAIITQIALRRALLNTN